jgi:hypothetical protein
MARASITNMYANNMVRWNEDPLREDLLIGDPNGEPYAVFIEGPSVIPVSVVIFAQSEDDAKDRVKQAIINIRDHGYTGSLSERDSRSKWILELIDKGGMTAVPINKGMLLKAPWAGNDYLV